MKKITHKILLRRETVRALATPELTRAVGGQSDAVGGQSDAVGCPLSQAVPATQAPGVCNVGR